MDTSSGSPAYAGSVYYDYKQYHFMALQGVADVNNKFIYVDVDASEKQSVWNIYKMHIMSES